MTRFDLFYINLDRATGRRTQLEKSFSASRFSNRWSLHRFAAVDAESDLVRTTPGTISPAFKGNYFSHVHCLQQVARRDAHLFIVEDDVQFSPETGPILEALIDQLPEDSWDVIHTEIAPMFGRDFLRFYEISLDELARNRVRLLELKNFSYSYASSSSYVVNRRSKAMIAALFGEEGLRLHRGELNFPYDICLRGVINKGALNGFLTMPFLTAPSVEADESLAPFGPQDSETRATQRFFQEVYNAFRRLIWVGYKPGTAISSHMAQLAEGKLLLSERDREFRQILSWVLSLQAQTEPLENAIPPLAFRSVEIARSHLTGAAAD